MIYLRCIFTILLDADILHFTSSHQELSQWPTLAPIPMDRNSLSVPLTPPGLTENTLCSGRLQREWILYERWRAWEIKVVKLGLR